MDYKQLSVKVPAPLARKLGAAARKQDRSQSAIVRAALREYLEDTKPKKRKT